MDLEELKKKLIGYDKKDIIITEHAELQAYIRQIDLDEVRNNVVNPEKLVFIEQQESQKQNEEKYNCYFAYSKDLSHRYILTVNGKVIIVTIIKINRDWQKILEGK